MKLKLRNLIFFLFIITQTSIAQTKWGIQGRYLTKDGKQIYLSGVNYVVSDGWMINLPNLSAEKMDADMAALESIGVNHIRFFPMWQLTQPTIDKLDEKVMKKLDLLIESAGKHHISIQLAPITGFMSGAAFLPPWAVGDVFRDQKIIDGQKYLCKTIAERYKNNPAVLGYDFGNELNVLIDKVGDKEGKPYVAAETLNWMNQIYPSFKNASPNQLVTNGIGTGYNSKFDIRNMNQTVDYFAPHSYPYFHGTINLDPWFGQRTTYSANFIATWCGMMGKPVVIQEIGCSEAWVPPAKLGAYIRLNYLSNWADGAAGFLWWGSHNIDTIFRVKSKDMILPLSSPSFAKGKFDRLEYNLGLFDNNNHPKEYASSFLQCVRTVEKLGLSWTDLLPVCYIIIPGNISFESAMHEYITAYVLAKQAHFDVKMCYEGTPIPNDAQAVFIPGLKLTGKARDIVQEYLVKGGKVYQSFENDFGTAIHPGKEIIVNNPSLIVCQPTGMMEAMQRMSIPASISFRETSYTAPAEPIVSYLKDFRQYVPVKEGIYYSQPVGKGTFYYFSGKLEKGLVSAYNPWAQTNCELLYSALMPRTPVEIDNKFIEIYLRKNEHQTILMLLNHSDQYQNTTVKSGKPIKLINFETQQNIGSGNEITVMLKPAEVVIAIVE